MTDHTRQDTLEDTLKEQAKIIMENISNGNGIFPIKWVSKNETHYEITSEDVFPKSQITKQPEMSTTRQAIPLVQEDPQISWENQTKSVSPADVLRTTIEVVKQLGSRLGSQGSRLLQRFSFHNPITSANNSDEAGRQKEVTFAGRAQWGVADVPDYMPVKIHERAAPQLTSPLKESPKTVPGKLNTVVGAFHTLKRVATSLGSGFLQSKSLSLESMLLTAITVASPFLLHSLAPALFSVYTASVLTVVGANGVYKGWNDSKSDKWSDKLANASWSGLTSGAKGVTLLLAASAVAPIQAIEQLWVPAIYIGSTYFIWKEGEKIIRPTTISDAARMVTT